MPRLTLYTRRRCHLCDVVKEILERTRATHPFDLKIVDIDNPNEHDNRGWDGERFDANDLRARFGNEVPVVEINGRKAFKYRLTYDELVARLGREAE